MINYPEDIFIENVLALPVNIADTYYYFENISTQQYFAQPWLYYITEEATAHSFGFIS